jgi:hypothetical protein
MDPSHRDECIDMMATLEARFILCEMCKCAPWTLFANESIALASQLADPNA